MHRRVASTAGSTALWRALESESISGILYDPYAKFVAHRMLGEQKCLTLSKTLAAPFFQKVTALRTRIVDEIIEETAVEYERNVVLLGCGLDSRKSFRRRE